MEFEALFLGLEPLTALAIGVGAAILAPVVDGVGKAIGQDPKMGAAVSESARENTKKALVWGFGALETFQSTFAEAEESFRDLVADAKTEYNGKKSEKERTEPREVEIVSE